MNDDPSRRNLLALLGTGAAAALAGCGEGDPDATDETTGTTVPTGSTPTGSALTRLPESVVSKLSLSEAGTERTTMSGADADVEVEVGITAYRRDREASTVVGSFARSVTAESVRTPRNRSTADAGTLPRAPHPPLTASG